MPVAARRRRQPWWVRDPETAVATPPARCTNPATVPRSKARTAPSGSSAVAATVCQVPVAGAEGAGRGAGGQGVVDGRADRGRGGGQPGALGCGGGGRGDGRGAGTGGCGLGGGLGFSAADRRCSSSTNPSRGSSTPGRAARSSIAARSSSRRPVWRGTPWGARPAARSSRWRRSGRRVIALPRCARASQCRTVRSQARSRARSAMPRGAVALIRSQARSLRPLQAQLRRPAQRPVLQDLRVRHADAQRGRRLPGPSTPPGTAARGSGGRSRGARRGSQDALRCGGVRRGRRPGERPYPRGLVVRVVTSSPGGPPPVSCQHGA